jgi:hypothetical protein
VAKEVVINGTGTAKIRNPVAVALLTLIPFYGLFWWYQVNREMADLGVARNDPEGLGDSPETSLLAIFPGGLLIVPAIVSLYNGVNRMQRTQEVTMGRVVLSGWVVLILIVFVLGIVAAGYMQAELNKAWETRPALTAGSTEGIAQPSATEPVPTERQPPPQQ